MQDLLAEVRESIATVLDEQCSSLAVHGFTDGRNALDQELQSLVAELGWLAISLPEASGGIGLGSQGLAVLNYELGRASAPGSFLATSVALEALARSEAAGAEPIAGLIADVVAGSVTLALSASMDVQRTDGAVWLLGDASAKSALIAGEGDDIELIDLDASKAEQLRIWDDTRSVISFPMSACKKVMTLRGLRPTLVSLYALALAADSAGAARGTLDRTIAYMKEREQFGRPIGSFQALKHRAADHQVNAKGADELVWQAAEQIDASLPGALLWSVMAKANVTEVAARIAGDCVQLHGGVGFTCEYDPHLFLKRVRLDEMLLLPNGALRDEAARAFADALGNDDDVLEIA